MKTGETKPRRALVAALLSLIAPGLGHLYAGSAVKGVALLLVTLGLMPLGPFGFLPIASWLRTAALVAFLVFSAVWIIAFADSLRVARRAGKDYALKAYNRWYLYAALALLSVPISMGWAAYVRANVMEAFKTPTSSMIPTIVPGDRVFVNKLAYGESPLRRGDIVVFRPPKLRHQFHVKRVVALAGDTVEIRRGALVLNGSEIEQRPESPSSQAFGVGRPGGALAETLDGRRYFVLNDRDPSGKYATCAEVKVPEGHCFVLGDNRPVALDSRDFGPVPLADLVGRVELAFYPRWANLLPEEGTRAPGAE